MTRWLNKLLGSKPSQPIHKDPQVLEAQDQITKAEENAKSEGKRADHIKSELRRHRQENHFSDLIDSVLRGNR